MDDAAPSLSDGGGAAATALFVCAANSASAADMVLASEKPPAATGSAAATGSGARGATGSTSMTGAGFGADLAGAFAIISANDVGCCIRVEAEPLDPDFHGKAIGEFGPVQLDVYARQHLEQILGAGGNQFSVSVIMNDGGSSFDVKEECQDATLYINQHVLKISLKNNHFDDRYQNKKGHGI